MRAAISSKQQARYQFSLHFSAFLIGRSRAPQLTTREKQSRPLVPMRPRRSVPPDPREQATIGGDPFLRPHPSHRVCCLF
ncbi:hypothetical protein VTN96DRAFT_6043 [Rasamsonia emersonii]